MSMFTRTAARLGAVLAVLALTAGPSWAQPTLESLWPNDDGIKWTYDFAGWDLGNPPVTSNDTWDGEATLTLAGTTATPGGTAQNLVGWHSASTSAASTKTGPLLSPLQRNLWRARPDLREAIVARARRQPPRVAAEDWVPLLLHPGYFMKLTNRIEMWQDVWDHSTWTYLTDALGIGQMFTHQLIPELADDVFLYGTVADNDAMVTTPAGVFTNAVRIDYEIDYGESPLLDEQAQPIGTNHARTTGWVVYVPDVGPVDMQEDFIPYDVVDCSPGECPQEILDQVGDVFLHLTMQLTAGPVAVEEIPWGAVKQLYR
jgi:hypothetical protein